MLTSRLSHKGSTGGKLGRGDPHTLEVMGSFHLGGDRDRKFRKQKDHFERSVRETGGRGAGQNPDPKPTVAHSEVSLGYRAQQPR